MPRSMKGIEAWTGLLGAILKDAVEVMTQMTQWVKTWMLLVLMASAIPRAMTQASGSSASALDETPGRVDAGTMEEGVNSSVSGFEAWNGLLPTPTPTPLTILASSSMTGSPLSSSSTPKPLPSVEVAGDAESTATPKPPSEGTIQPLSTKTPSASPATTPPTVHPSLFPPIRRSNSSSTATPTPTSKSASPSASQTQHPSANATPRPSSTPAKSTSAPTKTPPTALKTPTPAHETVTLKTAAPAPKKTPASTPKPTATTQKPVVATPEPSATTKIPMVDAMDTMLSKISLRPTTPKPTTPNAAPASVPKNATSAPHPTAPTNKPVAPAPTRKTQTPSTKTPASKAPSPTPSRKVPTLVDNIVIKTDNRSTGSRDDTAFPTTAPVDAGVGVVRHTDDETASQDNKVTTIVTKTSVIIVDNASSTEFHRYGRGIAKTRNPAPRSDSSTGEDATHDVITIGGRNRTRVVPGADVAVSAISRSAHDVMRLGCCGFVIASMVLLVVYHTLALISPTWLPNHRQGTTKEVSWLVPNTWELLVVASFFQHLGSLSMLVLPMAPYYVVDFTDALSWTNFHISGMKSHVSERRLDYVILMGMVAYADRLGIDEGHLLAYSTRCFFVVAGVLIVGSLITTAIRRWPVQRHKLFMQPHTDDATLCSLGLAVAVWSLSTFPLSATSSHELTMELGYALTGDFVIVLFNVFVVMLGGLALFTWTVGRISANRTLEYYHFAVFGTLYADHRRETRYTFVVFTLFQISTGAVIGGIQDNPTQLIALLVLHGIVLFALTAVRPYRQLMVNVYACVLMGVRIANLIFATAFTTTSTIATSSRGLVATSFVTLNFVVVLAIFFRQFLVFVYVLRLWSTQTRQGSMPSQRGSLQTHVHVEMRSARLGSEFDPTLRRFSTRQSIPTPCDFAASGSVESPVPNLANRPEPLAFRNDDSR